MQLWNYIYADGLVVVKLVFIELSYAYSSWLPP